jgi:hypothetical protein
MALITKAIMEPASETVAGRMSASVVLANSPNFVMEAPPPGQFTNSVVQENTVKDRGIVPENEPFAPSRSGTGEQWIDRLAYC